LTRALWGALIGIGVLAVGAYVAISHYTVRRAQRAGQMVLAVLPFDDLSSDPQDYLGDGLTEEMIQKATRISPQHLRVIARTSAMQYRHTQKSAREIGQELGADYILENSIRHEGARLRITTQLVRTADQTHLWAENYDREMRSLLSVEGDVTAEIAEQLRLQLAPPASNRRAAKPRPANPEAHELYLQGRYLFNQRSRAGLQQSLNYFQRAAEKDPGYAAAYAGMADAYNLIAFFGFDPTLGSVSQAKIAADKALQLDDTMAAAHAALAYTEFMWRGDWPAAEREFQRALQLDDNYVPAHHWYALYLASIGRMDESLNQMRYAQRLDPLSPAVHAGLGYMYYFARDYDHAIEQARVALQLNPDFMVAHAVLGWAYTEQKNYPLATAELEAATRLSGGVSVYQCALGRAYALSGNVREARKILAAQRSSVAGAPQGSGSILASLYLALGDSEQALHWLEVTAPGDIQANWLRVDPAFDGLRGNPRFAEVQRRIGTARQD
jgi:TolB-like protein/Flp pilus assembly protein TadD